MQKRCFYFLFLLLITTYSIGFAHSGETDSNQGHTDTRNISGLGDYHYHCNGNPAHLHPAGVCPYQYSVGNPPVGGQPLAATMPAATATSNGAAMPTTTSGTSTASDPSPTSEPFSAKPLDDTISLDASSKNTELMFFVMATPPASEETQIAFGDFTARQQPGPNTLSLPADYVGREAEVRFGKTNVPNVNLRVQPQTNANRVDKLHEKDMTVMILDSVVDSDGTDWYLVWHVSRKAYVKAEFIDIINEEAFWALH